MFTCSKIANLLVLSLVCILISSFCVNGGRGVGNILVSIAANGRCRKSLKACHRHRCFYWQSSDKHLHPSRENKSSTRVPFSERRKTIYLAAPRRKSHVSREVVARTFISSKSRFIIIINNMSRLSDRRNNNSPISLILLKIDEQKHAPR